jgi:hypothetical protein
MTATTWFLGMRMTGILFGSPRAADPDENRGRKRAEPMVRAQVTIIRRTDHTDIRITPAEWPETC